METIVLKGPANCGKSHTLSIAYQLLLNIGYTQVLGHFSQAEAFNFLGEKVYGNKDFSDILVKDGRMVGIATGEDSEKELSARLNYFRNVGCAIAICSYSDGTESLAIIREYTPHILINKTSEITDSLKRIHDNAFAKIIIAHI
jgi:hypothetical protein